MGTKKTLKETNTAANDQVVTADFDSSALTRVPYIKKLTPKHRYFALLAVLLVLVVVGIFVFKPTPAPQVTKTPLPSGIDSDYAGTELSNYPVLLQHDYGLTENDIMHGNLNKELKTFDEAQNVAIAIARLGNQQRSLEAYKIAVKLAPKDTSFEFYINMMGLGFQQGDTKFAEQMHQQAITTANQSKLSASDKATALKRIQGLYEIAKQQGKNT